MPKAKHQSHQSQMQVGILNLKCARSSFPQRQEPDCDSVSREDRKAVSRTLAEPSRCSSKEECLDGGRGPRALGSTGQAG